MRRGRATTRWDDEAGTTSRRLGDEPHKIPSHSRCHPRGHPHCHLAAPTYPHCHCSSGQAQPSHALTLAATQVPRPPNVQLPSLPPAAALTLHPHSCQVPRRHSGSDECAGSRCITAASQMHQTGRRKCAGPGAGPVMWGRRDDNVAALVRGGRGGGQVHDTARRDGHQPPSPPSRASPLPHSDSLD